MSYTILHTAPLFTLTILHNDGSMAKGYSDREQGILAAISAIPTPDWPPDKLTMKDLGGNVWRLKVEWPASKVFSSKMYINGPDFVVQDGSVKDVSNGEIEAVQALRAILVDMILDGKLIDLDFDRIP